MVEDGGHSLLNRIFGGLSHPRRRCILYSLRKKGTAAVADLAATVAAWEQDVPVGEVSDATSRRVQADLRHVHLPKLENDGFLEYDFRSSTVRYDSQPDALDEFIDLASRFEEPP